MPAASPLPPRHQPPGFPLRERLPRALVAALCAACLWAAAWGTLAAYQVLLTVPVPPDTPGRVEKLESRVMQLEAQARARRAP